MECAICNKSFTVDLSVCPACGTMKGDSVREELVTKSLPKISLEIVPETYESLEFGDIDEPLETEMIFQPVRSETITTIAESQIIPEIIIPETISRNEEPEVMSQKLNPPIAAKSQMPLDKEYRTVEPPVIQPPVQQKADNLVEFQTKNTVLPEWRLQLQNVVRERMQNKNIEGASSSDSAENPPNASSRVLRTQGNAALKIAPVEEEIYVEEAKPEKIEHENEKVRNALDRIRRSRQQFLVEEKQAESVESAESQDKRDFPFHIAARNDSGELRIARKNSITVPTKPTLVSSLRNGKEDFDTNKLPPIPQPGRLISSMQTRTVQNAVEEKNEVIVKEQITVAPEIIEEKIPLEKKVPSEEELKRMVDTEAEEEFEKNQEAEDYAPFTLRFNAGLFDLLIGSFISLILLSPFMLLGGEWFTFAGLFAFLATTAIVMFIYLTTSIGLFGKSFGMRLFSLELIDIENEDYPTFHQAAVSSSVYLVSLALGGLGFLTVPFNEDSRAVHDLVSNTLVVREL